MTSEWLVWARSLQEVAATGLAYAADPHDRERYEQVARIAGELAAAHGSPLAPEAMSAMLGADAGHPTPKVDVRGAVFRDGRILLVREREDGGWTMPGGWADLGETPSGAVEREVREEAGLTVRATRLIAVQDRDRHNFPPHVHRIFKLFFLCEDTGAPPLPRDHETDGLGWFAPAEIPPLSTGRTSESQIAQAFAHRADPALPASFD